MTFAPQEEAQVFLDVYGVKVVMRSADAAIIDHLSEDFAHFQIPALSPHSDISLHLHPEAPPYESVPPRPATVYTPRNVSFHEDGKTYIDYSGRALGILHADRLDVFSEDADLLYEVGYLFLLSRLGERLDERHMHRIHALGISVAGKAALVLLPMGGGKSTLVTHLLADPRVDLLSDDSPFVDREGMLYAFPLRIGVLPGGDCGYEPGQLRTIQRMEFGPKLLLRYEYFASRIVGSSQPAFLFLGKRSLAEKCVIRPASKLAALRALVPNCIIGLGLFQGMEFVFNRDVAEVGRKAAIALSRLRNCISLVRKSTTVTVVLGRDLENNAQTLLSFLETHH